jgi:hypothetical protein
MNIRQTSLYLLAVTVFLAGCGPLGERHHVRISRDWPASAIEKIEVRGINGDVRVEAAKVDQVKLVADVRARGAAPDVNDPNRGYFTTELAGNTLRIVQKGRRGKRVILLPFRSNQAEIDYALIVPEQIAVDLNTVNGRIATRGVAGDANLRSVNGTIDAEVGGANSFEAQTVNGRIRATFKDAFHGARLKTVNGGVQAILPASASFTCDLAQVNGDFEASFPLNIHSHPGRRRVSGEVNGGRYQLKITTVNGSVRVQHVDVPEVPEAPEAMPEIPEVPDMPEPAVAPPAPVS